MDSSWLENMSSDRKIAIEKLLQGQNLTTQLHDLLMVKHDHLVAEDLFMKISTSFTDVLSILNGGVSDIPVNGRRKLEDSDENSLTPTSSLKDRRGCYKRRKSANSRTRMTSTLLDDGHAWRKYGQKAIQNATNPRSYFRCTHKYDQNCMASKQVQKTEDDPTMYKITYNGQHTCKNILKTPQIIFDQTREYSEEESSSTFLSFGSPNVAKPEKNDSEFPMVKMECKENDHNVDVLQGPTSIGDFYPDFSEYLLSSDLTTFDSSRHMTAMTSSPIGSPDCGDVISEMRTSVNLDMDFIGMMNFDDVLEGYEF